MKYGLKSNRLFFSSIFCYGAAIHLYWAFCLVFSSDPLLTTPLSPFLLLSDSRYVLAFIFFLASLAAILASFAALKTKWVIAGFFWQQVFMLFSLFGALEAILTRTYADGVVRSFFFISPDQINLLVGSLVHTIAVLQIHRRQ